MLNITLLTIFYFLFAILSWRQTAWAIYIVIASLPLYIFRFHLDFVPMTLLEGMILILFITFVFRNFKERKLREIRQGIRQCSFFWPSALLMTAATISIFTSPDLRAALGIWKAYFVEPVLLIIVVANVIKGIRQFRGFIWSLGIAAVWISFLGVIQYFTGLGIPSPWYAEEVRRITGLYEYPNAVGLFLAPILTLFLGILITQVRFFKPRNLWWFVLIILLTLFAILASGSEGAWLATAAGVTFYFLLSRFRRIYLLILIVLIILIFLIPQARNYALPIITFQDVSGDVRLVMWQGTWNLLKAHPLFGAGLAGFPVLYEQYRLIKHTEFLMYPHNIFLSFWVETGLLGLLAMIWLILQYFREGVKIIKSKALDYQYAVVLLGVMISFLIYGLVDEPYFKNDLSVMFWLWFSLMILAIGSGSESKEDTQTIRSQNKKDQSMD